MTESNDPIVMTIAVLGGTGKEGSGLAVRWALNGYRVIIGSREADKAVARAGELNAELGGDYLIGMSNVDAAKEAYLVVLSVPYTAHKSTLESVKEHLTGKVLVDVTVPLAPPKITSVNIPEGKSACMEAQAFLGDSVKVVAAFQNVSADKLKDPTVEVNCDVLLCSDYPEAKEDVMALVKAAGLRGIDAGGLVNAVAVEALTPVLLYINRAYKVKGAGIRITNLE
ncbi:MAG: NADPH-dependent F420 reductase [Phototrophicales bacterium]|nr:NADPH-dependent F420 reductase [Phototrophicales bacterium]